jgi:hypothetical protein
MEKGCIFVSKTGPTSSASFFPVILLAKEEELQLVLHNVSEIPFSNVQDSEFLYTVQSQDDFITVGNEQVQHCKAGAPLFETLTQEFELRG